MYFILDNTRKYWTAINLWSQWFWLTRKVTCIHIYIVNSKNKSVLAIQVVIRMYILNACNSVDNILVNRTMNILISWIFQQNPPWHRLLEKNSMYVKIFKEGSELEWGTQWREGGELETQAIKSPILLTAQSCMWAFNFKFLEEEKINK